MDLVSLVAGCLSIGEMEATDAVVLSQIVVVSMGLAGYEVWFMVFGWFTKGGLRAGDGERSWARLAFLYDVVFYAVVLVRNEGCGCLGLA